MNDNGYIAYHKDFESIFQDIKKAKIGKLVPSEGSTISIDDFFAYSEAKVDYYDDEIKSLEPSKGQKAIDEFNIGGFDESFAEFSAIEGSIFNKKDRENFLSLKLVHHIHCIIIYLISYNRTIKK